MTNTIITITIAVADLRLAFKEFCKQQLMPEHMIQSQWEEWYDKQIFPRIQDEGWSKK